MPRQNPTLEDIALPGVQGARPVAGYDVSAWGQGAQALAKSGQVLGTDIQKSAQDIAETRTYQARNNALLAQDDILGKGIALREKYKHDTDFDTLGDRYNADLDNVVNNGLQNVPEGPLRTHVQARLQIPLAHERASINEQVFQGQRQNAHADLYDRAANLVETAPAMPDSDPLHSERMHSYDQIADEYASKGLITPLEKAQHTQRMLLGVADAEARKRGDLGPAEAAKVERELRASAYGRGTFGPGSTGSGGPAGPRGGPVSFSSPQVNDAISKAARATGLDEGMLRQFVQIESRGRPGPESDTGSYKGLLQLKQDEFQRNGGGDIYNPYDNAMAGAKKLKAESAAFTQQYGRAPTAADLYLIHNQGVGGYAAHMANPNAPAWQNMLSTAEGRQKGAAWAREAIWRNVPDQNKPGFGNVNNVTSRDFVSMWSQRLGGNATADLPPGELPPANAQAGQSDEGSEAPSGFNPLFAKLTPQHRDALIARMQTIQRQYQTDAHTQLQAGIKDKLAAASREGYIGTGLSLDDFKSVYGDQAEAAYGDYNHQLQMAMDMHNMAGMAPEERHALIAGHAPDPSQPGYAARFEPFSKLLALNQKLDEASAKSALEERKAAIADLSKRAQGVAIEAARTGQVQGIARDEFIKALGEEQGAAAWNAYTDATQYAVDFHNLGDKTPEEKQAVVDAYTPRPGQDNIEQAWQRHDELRKAADNLHKQLTDDPAGYMLRNSGAVRDAWTAFGNATTPQDQAKAAQDFAAKTVAEQTRFGVAPQDIKVVPDDYAENFKGKIEQMAQAGNANLIYPAIKQEQERWGTAWPQVYRQVADSPMLRVLGAGVKAAAGSLLANNANVKFADIVKDEQSAKAKDIREGVDTAMAPFASSLGGMTEGIPLYNDIRGQVEKLAAIYAFNNGMDAEHAAKQAVEDTLNFKYEYRDGYRIPKDEPTSADAIQRGASIAQGHLGKTIGGLDLRARPAIDTFGAAYTPAQLASETANTKKTGRWATNGDESGLWFVYNNRVVKKPDGMPVQLTWKQLADLAGSRPAEGGIGAAGLAVPP